MGGLISDDFELKFEDVLVGLVLGLSNSSGLSNSMQRNAKHCRALQSNAKQCEAMQNNAK